MSNWKGTTVPNSGTVENVYFNTNLSVDEVYNLVNSIDYDFSTLGNYFILANESFDVHLIITATNPSEAFVIQGAIGEESVIIFSYNFLEESEGGDGWQTFNNPLTVNTTAISEVEGITIGSYNEKISSLFSITPFTQGVTLEELLTDTCDAIREKEGTTNEIPALDIPARIRALSSGSSGSNTSDATATASDILQGKTAYTASGKVEGTIETYNGENEGGVVGGGVISCACQPAYATNREFSQETMTLCFQQVIQEMIDDGIQVYRYKLSITDTGLVSEKILVSSGEEMPCVVNGYYIIAGMTQEEFTSLNTATNGMLSYMMLISGIPQTWECIFPETYTYKMYVYQLDGTEAFNFNVSGTGKYVADYEGIPLTIDVSPRVEFMFSD